MSDPNVTIGAVVRHAEQQMATELPGWKAYGWERGGGGGDIVEGAVVTAFKTRGPRKGDPKWPAASDRTWRKVPVMSKDVVAMLRTEEHETGKCADCRGTGQQTVGCGLSGPKTRDCSRCSATGVAPKKEENAP